MEEGEETVDQDLDQKVIIGRNTKKDTEAEVTATRIEATPVTRKVSLILSKEKENILVTGMRRRKRSIEREVIHDLETLLLIQQLLNFYLHYSTLITSELIFSPYLKVRETIVLKI